MVDTTNILIEFLIQTGTDLYALVGDRVRAGVLPELEEQDLDQKAVLVRRNGGLNDMYVPILRPSYQIECFGGSEDPLDGQEVYSVLFEMLFAASMETMSEGILMSAIEGAGGQDLHDEKLDRPFVLSFWELECRAAA